MNPNFDDALRHIFAHQPFYDFPSLRTYITVHIDAEIDLDDLLTAYTALSDGGREPVYADAVLEQYDQLAELREQAAEDNLPSLDTIRPEIQRAMQTIPFFDLLSEDEYRQLAASVILEEVHQDEVVFQDYDHAEEVLYVVSRGTLRVHHKELSKRRSEIFKLESGGFFGKHPILAGVCRGCTISAETPVTLLRLEQTYYFKTALRLRPELRPNLVATYLAAFLTWVPPFSSLDETQTLARLLTVVEFSPEQQICSQGAPCDRMYILYSGKVSAVRIHVDGSQSTRDLDAGDYFGARSLLLSAKWDESLVATNPATVLVVPLDAFDELIVKVPQLVPDVHDLVRFSWQMPGEHVVYHARSHWTYVAGRTAVVVVTTWLVSSLLLDAAGSLVTSSLLSYVRIGLLGVAFLFAVRVVALWWSSYYVVTTERVASREPSSFDTASTEWEDISALALAQIGCSRSSVSVYTLALPLLVPVDRVLRSVLFISANWDHWLLALAGWVRQEEHFALIGCALAYLTYGWHWIQKLTGTTASTILDIDEQSTSYSLTIRDVVCEGLLELRGGQFVHQLNRLLKTILAHPVFSASEVGDVTVGYSRNVGEHGGRPASDIIFRRVLSSHDVAEIINTQVSRASRRGRIRQNLLAQRELKRSLGLVEETEDLEGDVSRAGRYPGEKTKTWPQHWIVSTPRVVLVFLEILLWGLAIAANEYTWFPFKQLGFTISYWLFGTLFIVRILIATIGKVFLLLSFEALLLYLTLAVFLGLFPFDTPRFQCPPETIALICLIASAWSWTWGRSYARRRRERAGSTDHRVYKLRADSLTAESTKLGHDRQPEYVDISLDKVQSINGYKTGLTGRLFDFGDVRVCTADGSFVLRRVPRPKRIEQELWAAVDSRRETDLQRELRSLGEYIKEWLVAYAGLMEKDRDIAQGRPRIHADDPSLRAHLRILFVIAQPVNCEPLQYWDEWDRIVEVLSEVKGRLYVARAVPPTYETVERELGRGYHILHFIGHGTVDQRSGSQGLILEDAYGQGEAILSTDLRDMLAMQRVRLVILNSCESDILAKELAGDHGRVQGVIGMKGPISDQVGIEFAGAFYKGLVTGKPINDSFLDARRAIRKDRRQGARAPVLEGTATGIFFEPVPGSGKARFESGSPQYSNLSRLPEPGEHYYDPCLVRIAQALHGSQNHLIVITGSSADHRTQLARAAAERNSWRFRGGVVCVSGDGKEQLSSSTMITIAEVMNFDRSEDSLILAALADLAEQGSPVLFVFTDLDQRMLQVDHEFAKLLRALVDPRRNKALITCSCLSETVDVVPGLVEITLLQRTANTNLAVRK